MPGSRIRCKDIKESVPADPEPPSATFVIIAPKPMAPVREAGEVPPDWKADD